MSNKERVEKLVLDFFKNADVENAIIKGTYKLWEKINEDFPTIEELLELGYIGLFVTTLDACVALCLLENDMVGAENFNSDEAKEHRRFRAEMLDLRLRQLFVKIYKERLIK